MIMWRDACKVWDESYKCVLRVPLTQQAARKMRRNSRDNNCNPQRESGELGLCKASKRWFKHKGFWR